MIGLDDVIQFYSAYKMAVETLTKARGIIDAQTIHVGDFFSSIERSDLEYGTDIQIQGVFSDFVPIAREMVFDIPEYAVDFEVDPLPCKPFPIQGYRCGSLQHGSSSFAGHPKCIPVFYEIDTRRPIDEYLSGYHAIISGKLVSLPDKWGKFLDIETPVGIKANSIEIQNSRRSDVGIYLWKIVKDSDRGDLKPGEGFILTTGVNWQGNFSISDDRILCMIGGKSRLRHGDSNEDDENIQELYLANLAEEETFKSHSNYYNSLFPESPIDAQWDMSVQEPNQTKWLRNQLK